MNRDTKGALVIVVGGLAILAAFVAAVVLIAVNVLGAEPESQKPKSGPVQVTEPGRELFADEIETWCRSLLEVPFAECLDIVGDCVDAAVAAGTEPRLIARGWDRSCWDTYLTVAGR